MKHSMDKNVDVVIWAPSQRNRTALDEVRKIDPKKDTLTWGVAHRLARTT